MTFCLGAVGLCHTVDQSEVHDCCFHTALLQLWLHTPLAACLSDIQNKQTNFWQMTKLKYFYKHKRKRFAFCAFGGLCWTCPTGLLADHLLTIWFKRSLNCDDPCDFCLDYLSFFSFFFFFKLYAKKGWSRFWCKNKLFLLCILFW